MGALPLVNGPADNQRRQVKVETIRQPSQSLGEGGADGLIVTFR